MAGRLGEHFPDEGVEWWTQFMGRAPFRRWSASSRHSYADIRADLPKIKCPTLVITTRKAASARSRDASGRNSPAFDAGAAGQVLSRGGDRCRSACRRRWSFLPGTRNRMSKRSFSPRFSSSLLITFAAKPAMAPARIARFRPPPRRSLHRRSSARAESSARRGPESSSRGRGTTWPTSGSGRRSP